MAKWLNLAAVCAVFAAVSLIVVKNAPGTARQQLVNVSYDPTRELYQTLNPLFVASYEKETGQHLTIVQSHGGSSQQARKIISGEQPADVVTLGLFSDVDSLRKRGLIAAGWSDRLPHNSLPYSSTIVFVVRNNNPRGIKDWPDLLAPGIEIVTPDPRTSGNGKLVALAAWAAMVTSGGTETEARAFLVALYRHVQDMNAGARGAAINFALQDIGDVHLTWENEAIREVAESNGKLQIVYPPVSILAEPYVAWVDSIVAQDGNLRAAKAYLAFLFSDTAQKTIAHLGYRPVKTGLATFPGLTLVPVTAIARDWDDANEKFFAENGVIDTILGTKPK
jgi:sulfate transport system substrate-binding protein